VILDAYALKLKVQLEAMESVLLRELEQSPEAVAGASRYITDAGGKRLRPLLLLACADLMGYRRKDRLTFAAVVEALHTATLIHDDVIDEAELRRGRRTLHRELGNRLTILVGDYLYAQVIRLAVQKGNLGIIRTLSEATLKMTEGEIWGLTHAADPRLTLDDYLEHIERKTGYLFAAAASIPALLAGQERHYRRLHGFGLRFGVFFQILDDLQDFAAREEEAGKPVMHDLEEGKLGLPVLLLLQRAKGRERRELLDWLKDAPRHKFDILERLQAHGTLVLAREMARQRAAKACSVLSVFPASPAKALLTSLPDRLLSLPAFARL
jgi:octaprenyl-diphosphate synthase